MASGLTQDYSNSKPEVGSSAESHAESPIVLWGMRAFFVMWVVIFPFVVFFAIRAFLEGRASQSWPVVRGVVTKLDLVKDTPLSNSVRVDLKYRYQVDGKDYVGDRLNLIAEKYKNSAQRKRQLPA